MFDVTFPSGQADAEAPSADAGPFDSGLAFDSSDTPDPWDDGVLMAEPEGDVFGWDDEDEDDDEEEFDDEAELADDLDDDQD